MATLISRFIYLLAVDTPDPYVKIEFQAQPTIEFCTSYKSDEPNPVWNERFKVLLPSRVRHIKAAVSKFCQEVLKHLRGTLLYIYRNV